MELDTPGKCSFHQQKLLNIIKFQRKLFDSGLFQEKLKLLLPKGDIIDIKSFLFMNLNLLERQLSMLVSLPLNKKKTWKNKLNMLEKNTLNMKSLKILDLDLTLKEGDLSPFWNKSCMEMSKKLLQPTLTDLQELDLNLFSSSVNNTKQNLQFCQVKRIVPKKQNSLKNSSLLLPITLPNSMECENITYNRKIQIYPTKEQKFFFKNCFGVTRYLYNKTISMYENEKFPLTLASCRKLIMKKNSEYTENDEEKWITQFPYDTRQLAIKSALGTIKSNFSLLKNNTIKKFKLHFKTKKDKNQIFFIDHRAIKNLRLFPNTLKDNSKLKVKKKYKNYENYIPESDCILQKKDKKYFLLFTKNKAFKKQEKIKDIISLDPGIRTFQSFYTPDGIVGDLGNNELKNKIMKLENKIDKLKSIKKTNNCNKLKTKVCNIVKDFQWKISSFLCKTYKTILLPVFESKSMLKNLNSKINRYLNILSHYQFQEKMKYQSKKYGNNLIIVDESYTSKTCGNCGILTNIGSSKTHICSICKTVSERDYNAGRNIMLKYLGSDLTL